MFKFAIVGLIIGASLPAFAQKQATATTTATPEPATATVTPVNQRRVDPAAMYHRVYAIVPMIGSGAKGDPFRPMFIPADLSTAISQSGIVGYQMQASDDGKSALVEFVGISRSTLLPIITSTAAGVSVFERGTITQSQIEAAFQKYKKNFTMSMFYTRVQ